MALRLHRHLNELGQCRLEIWAGHIDNTVWATEWQYGTDETKHIMECRMKVVEMLADLHNMLGNELSIEKNGDRARGVPGGSGPSDAGFDSPVSDSSGG